jgi:anthranilate phosphoribosyltransferase
MATTMAGVLEANGVDHAIVCYGHDGLDELSTVTGSTIIELRRESDGVISRSLWEVDPVALGLAPAQPADLLGGDAQENAAFARAILQGAPGPHRDLVLVNAAAAFLVADAVGDLGEGLVRAAESIDSGAAAAALDRLVAVSRAAREAESAS